MPITSVTSLQNNHFPSTFTSKPPLSCTTPRHRVFHIHVFSIRTAESSSDNTVHSRGTALARWRFPNGANLAGALEALVSLSTETAKPLT